VAVHSVLLHKLTLDRKGGATRLTPAAAVWTGGVVAAARLPLSSAVALQILGGGQPEPGQGMVRQLPVEITS